jgi:hypothetical protein
MQIPGDEVVSLDGVGESLEDVVLAYCSPDNEVVRYSILTIFWLNRCECLSWFGINIKAGE